MNDDYKLWQLKQAADFAEQHNFMIKQFAKINKKLEEAEAIKKQSRANNEQMKPLIDFANHELPKLTHVDNWAIAALWASIKDIGSNARLEEDYRALIEEAVISNKLKAIVQIRTDGFNNGYKELENYNEVLEIEDGYLRRNGKRVAVSFVIKQEDLKDWLISINRYPLDNGCLLNEWFLSIKKEEKTSTDNNHDDIKTDDKEASKPSNNECEFSELLNVPKRTDDWFEVINDMAKEFYKENNKLPNEVQAWGQLWTRPPAGYEVTTGKDKGEDCLFMPSVKPLSRSAFKKRWSDYTRE